MSVVSNRGGRSGVYCQPTHWMPLPSPPAK
ncbi:DUF551 domain-containing protein [Enterobacter hormaechei]